MIHIREMEIGDLEQVMPIENALFSVPWTETGFFSFLLREDALFLVAEEAEKILGYCGIVTVLDEGDVTNVAVDPSRQRQGIGRQLVEALIDRCLERGVTTVHLEVRASNERAISLYEKLGFEKVGRRPGYYEAPTEDAVLMSRRQADLDL